ncbi:hypothetical protein C8F01DRAFT_454593 [Mycena amicta]|nr:hypothetical protein C8F01DRAFT_454593 [Mycena amicta]
MKFAALASLAIALGVSNLVAADPGPSGTIQAPVAGTVISSGSVIDFLFSGNIGACHQGFTPIFVYLTPQADPTIDFSTGDVEGTVVENYGEFLLDNVGIGHLPGLPPLAPSNLTIPDISSFASGSALYLTVVQEILPRNCPAGVNPAEYGASTVALTTA